jgi:hypothetical protein
MKVAPKQTELYKTKSCQKKVKGENIQNAQFAPLQFDILVFEISN